MKLNLYKSLIAIIVLSALFKLIFNNAFNVFNPFVLLRDVLIVVFFISSLRKKSTYNPNFILAGAFLVIFASAYLLISLFQNKFLEGLYFLRLYITPFLFFVATVGLFKNINSLDFFSFLRFLFRLNIVVLIVSIGLYTLSILISDVFFLTLLTGDAIDGTRKLANAWFISGANFLRMGLPMSGPNILAIYFVCNLILILILILKNKALLYKVNRYYPLFILFNCLGLVLTFSRSSILFLVLSFLILLIFNLNKLFKLTATYLCFIIPATIVLAYFTNVYTEGKLNRWFSLTLSFNDPSLKGHGLSFYEPFENFEDYYLIGYTRATVGPRALVFTNDIINVENSFFIIAYDMGIFLAIIFFTAYLFLFRNNLKTIPQLALIVGIIVNLHFLPNIFEVEILMYFLLVFLLAGIKFKDINAPLIKSI